ncbi:MAG: hypothetical protein CM1200mP32_08330 [Methanobacteriota archaeon]|nr:MAG: hypothetical protein CM1200mP32_08330 [Euryarchaeota archaeon]
MRLMRATVFAAIAIFPAVLLALFAYLLLGGSSESSEWETWMYGPLLRGSRTVHPRRLHSWVEGGPGGLACVGLRRGREIGRILDEIYPEQPIPPRTQGSVHLAGSCHAVGTDY